MKSLFTLALIIFGFTSNAGKSASWQGPEANAGPDQTIYLTQTSTVTLNGSASSGDSYQWTEISTDYKSGAKISSPTSAVTTVTGLPQGVFYFQLAVTSGGTTVTDVVVVTVDYDVPPAGATLLTQAIWSDMAYGANLRDDTTTCFSWSSDIRSLVGKNPNAFYMEKDGALGSHVDERNGKYYSTLLDGHGCTGYGRSELIPAQHAQDLLDSNKTYVIEWKGYFPQDMSPYAVSDFAGVIGQIHGSDDYSPPFGYALKGNKIYLAESFENGNGTGSPVYNPSINSYNYLMSAADLVNQTHTFRMIVREGAYYPNQKAFIEIKIDGITKFIRNVGQVGSTFMEDWIKGATMYDYGNLITDANNHTRGRKVSLTTESFKIYTLSNVPSATPTANAGSNQTITLPTNSVNLSGSGSVSGGSIKSYNWTKFSGPSGETVTSPNSQSTSITNLVEGTYVFQLKVTDNNGATATSTVQVTVNPPKENSLPKASAGVDQIITLPLNTVNLKGTGTDTDGTIASYSWSKTKGPSASIASLSSASTEISDLEQGEYTFQLKVTDDIGGIGTDTVHVSVKAAINQSPIAVAGEDQKIVLPTNTVSLSGKGTDGDGSIASYKWTKISGPAATIANTSSAATNVSSLVEGIYQFQLTVTDNLGATGKDTLLVSVKAGANLIPTTSAGADQTVTLPTNSVTLKGDGIDKDGTIASYSWTKISGPAATITDASSATTKVSGLIQGTYQFELKVTDDKGDSGKDTVQVKVNAASNSAPEADAGQDQTITLPTNSVTLSGSGNDSDGTIGSYSWTKISGSAATITDASSGITNVSGLLQGTYEFELKVTDDKGDSDKDTVQVKVNAASNSAPEADAGQDQTITLPTNSVTLSGSGSDTEGKVTSYSWNLISGPSTFKFKKANSATVTVNDLIIGTYKFQFEVKYDKGGFGLDTVQIIVNKESNMAPTANAGKDQTITLPANSVNLSGSGNDTDGTIESYSWTKVSGPSSYKISNANSDSTKVSELVEGIYQFELKVTDDKGAVGKDTVQVKVDSATNVSTPKENVAPTANAGKDQTITLPANSVNLSGSGNDTDGTIESYSWTKVSGPSSYKISNANSDSTKVSELVEGIYQFELKVTDDKGAVGKDTVQVKVDSATNVSTPKENVAPTANAGKDQTITLPANSVNLSGIGNDTDGTIESYSWTKVSGPSSYKISNANSDSTEVSGLVEGTYQFELKVTDDKGAVGKDTVQVKVDSATNVSTPKENVAPTANAGKDQTITLPANSVNLSGIGNDTDGTIESYSWTKVSGPSSYKISNANSDSTEVSGLVEGTYQFELKVTDDKGAVGKDTVQVKVDSATNVSTPKENVAPTANAGKDQTITLPANSVNLSGIGNDTDGTIESYSWTKVSGPSFYKISNANSDSTEVSGLVEGTYQFELKVTDDKGAVGKDTVQIKVNQEVTSTPEVTNSLPSVNAGKDQTITLPANSAILSGTATDADGTIASYSWTKISGPTSFSLINSSSSTASATGLVEGAYQFELKVTDDKGGVQKDTIQVTVLNETNTSTTPKENSAPIVNAGADQTITLPINSVTLSGSGTDTDGTIVSYSWIKVSGPVSFSVVNSSSATTNVTGLIQGTYQFELRITDDKGATGKDTVLITVDSAINDTPVKENIAPSADAGADITTVSSTQFVTLSGSGIDSDGKIASYLWSQISGPSSSAIAGGNAAVVKVRNLEVGTYEFELKVTDDQGAMATDTVRVTVALERTSSDNVVVKSTSLKVFPNPVRDVTTLEVTAPRINTNIMIVISDINGKTVYTKEFVSSSTYVTQQIDMSNLIKGTYIISVYFDGMQQQSIKVMRL